MGFTAGWVLGFPVGLEHQAQSKYDHCRVAERADLYGSGDRGGGGAGNTAEKEDTANKYATSKEKKNFKQIYMKFWSTPVAGPDISTFIHSKN